VQGQRNQESPISGFLHPVVSASPDHLQLSSIGAPEKEKASQLPR